jgi:antitoxin VapB
MPLSIRNPRAEALAREVARETGESITQAIATALEEKLERVRGRRTADDLVAEITAISRRCAALPTLDNRTEDEILGYGETGAPGSW